MILVAELLLAAFAILLAYFTLRARVYLRLEVSMPKAVALQDTIRFSIDPRTAAGEPAPVTDVTYSVSPEGAGTLTVDGNAATYAPGGDTGAFVVTVTAKSARGLPLADSVSFEVVAPVPEATTLGLKVELVPTP